MKQILFTVYGDAKPAGSKRAFVNPKTGKAIVTDDSGKAGRSWRQDVKHAAREAMGDVAPLDAPLIVQIIVHRLRPRSHYGTGRNKDHVKDSSPDYPTTRPDLLKLARGIEDALTGICYRDDALIVDELLLKRYSDTPKVRVVIRPK